LIEIGDLGRPVGMGRTQRTLRQGEIITTQTRDPFAGRADNSRAAGGRAGAGRPSFPGVVTDLLSAEVRTGQNDWSPLVAGRLPQPAPGFVPTWPEVPRSAFQGTRAASRKPADRSGAR
jgi:hypothetical protein